MKKGIILGAVIIVLISIFGIYRFATKDTMVISSSGTYEIEDNISNIKIKAKDVVIVNANVLENITIDKKVKDGSVTIRDSKIDGDLLVNGGGANSIHIESTKIKNIVANYSDVRIIIDEDSSVTTLNIDKFANLQISGKVNTINVNNEAKNSSIITEEGSEVNVIELSAKTTLKVSGPVSKIILNSNASKSVLTINAEVEKIDSDSKATINVNALVLELINTKNAKGSVIEVNKNGIIKALATTTTIEVNGEGQVDKIITDKDTNITGNNNDNIIITDKPINNNSNGNSINIPKEEKPIVILPEYINLTNITLDEVTKTLKYGESYNLVVNYLPSNATNKKVVYTSSDTNVAIVDEFGKITAVNKGVATITVTSNDGSKTAEIIITVELNTNNILSSLITSYKTMDIVLENAGEYEFMVNGVSAPYTVFENTYTLTVNSFDDENIIEVNKAGFEPMTNTVDKLANMVIIKNISDLDNAISNQLDNQIWIIKEGVYDLTKTHEATILNKLATWYMPITANGLIIVGNGNVTLMSTSEELLDITDLKNFITITGNDVKLENLTVITHEKTNKALNILGLNANLADITLNPNEKSGNAGSIFFGEDNTLTLGDMGTVIFNNVTINKGALNLQYVDKGTLELIQTTINIAGAKDLADLTYSYENFVKPLQNPNNIVITTTDLKVLVSNSLVEELEVINDRYDDNALQNTINNLPSGSTLTLSEGIYILNTEIIDKDGVIIDKSLATIYIKNQDVKDANVGELLEDKQEVTLNIDFDKLDITKLESIKLSLFNNEELLGTALSTSTNLVNLLKSHAIDWEQTEDTYLETKGIRTLKTIFTISSEETDDGKWVRSAFNASSELLPNTLIIEMVIDGQNYIIAFNK